MADTNAYADRKTYALVTGGTSGIGYELAKLLAKDGHNLIIASRSDEGLTIVSTEFTNDYNVDVKTYSIDLMVPGASKALYDQIISEELVVDILINDAGQGYWGEFVGTDLNREVDLVHLNIIALVAITKFFLKDMVARGEGRILQLASSLSKAPAPYFAVYAGTKAFVWSFSEALIQELKDTGVTLTALFPGATDTDFFHKAQGETSVEYRERDLYDPAVVAAAGYKGLMEGADKVVPGVKNKMQGIMGAILPDMTIAANMKRHLKESGKEEGRDSITHQRSAEERERINRTTGRPDGDLGDHSRHSHEA